MKLRIRRKSDGKIVGTIKRKPKIKIKLKPKSTKPRKTKRGTMFA